jgi:3-deoxy-manno-octulosonate cytidylyltransferase (CMP-KDO synthetase)
MKVAAFIPARYGSTRLEGKPLADICGRPMIQWVYERVRACGLVDGVTVATDDQRVFDAVLAFGGRAVMTDAAHSSGTDRIAEAARAVDADIIVNVQGDEPLIEPEMIASVIKPLIDDPELRFSTLKTGILDEEEYKNPHAVKVVCDARGRAIYFSRSPVPHGCTFGDGGDGGRGGDSNLEALPRAYKHIGLYAFRKDFLLEFSRLKPTRLERAERLEQLRALENGVDIMVVETPFNPVAVDTPEDLELVRSIIGNRAG